MLRAGLFIAPDGDTTAANKEAGSVQSDFSLITRELPMAAAATTKAGMATSSAGADNEAAHARANWAIGSGRASNGNRLSPVIAVSGPQSSPSASPIKTTALFESVIASPF
jgi:hypothetical protein